MSGLLDRKIVQLEILLLANADTFHLQMARQEILSPKLIFVLNNAVP